MARDLSSEEIGLAVSEDGKQFARVNGDGRVLPRDESVEWRALRVCNPTVLPDGDGFVMYYQGVAGGRGQAHTSIGIARSADGIEWHPEAEPIVDWRAMTEHDPDLDERRRVGVVEPAVLHEGDETRMWFVYRHASTPGNAIFCASRAEDGAWRIQGKVLSGADLGGLDLHYPQVERVDGSYVLYLTLRDARMLHGIFRMRSHDGRSWDELEPVLPADGQLEPSLYLRVLWHTPGRLRYRVFSGRNALGYAHPHVVHGNSTTLYYQAANLGPDGIWLDIGRCTLDGEAHERILEPADDPSAWDAFFVADPFVVVASE